VAGELRPDLELRSGGTQSGIIADLGDELGRIACGFPCQREKAEEEFVAFGRKDVRLPRHRVENGDPVFEVAAPDGRESGGQVSQLTQATPS